MAREDDARELVERARDDDAAGLAREEAAAREPEPLE
ncbi:MAG: hypothetical protein JWP53_974, partial [Conexibacter sp.]|nr:hypothetical protein [Conexibacter sp.]